MEDIIKLTIYAKIDQLMTSDGMQCLLVTSEDGEKYNLKSENELQDVFVGCIYEFEIAKYLNSEKNNGYIIKYVHIN